MLCSSIAMTTMGCTGSATPRMRKRMSSSPSSTRSSTQGRTANTPSITATTSSGMRMVVSERRTRGPGVG
jgi:hypothetical protein